MKKIISILLAALMLHTVAFAAPQISFNNEKRTIDISGVSEYKNRLLSVIITKKGTDPSDFVSSELVYKLKTNENGEYIGQFLLPDDTEAGKEYSVYISGDEETADFYLATSEEFSGCLEDFKNPDIDKMGEYLEKYKSVLGISLDGVYAKYTDEADKSMAELIADENPDTITGIMDCFYKACEAACLMEGDEKEVISSLVENLLSNTLEDKYETEDIAKMLIAVREKPEEGDDITDKISENLKVATAIVAVNVSTRGKMDEVLEKYNDIFELELDGDYASLSDVEVNKALTGKDFTSVKEIRDAFEKSVKDVKSKKNKPSGSTGGSSSGGNSGGGLGAGTFSPSVNTNKEETAKAAFNDLSDVLWAESAIKNLCEKGIVSGYGNGLFMPQKAVTRAEFVKMIVLASGSEDENKNTKFTDVADDDWFAPYIRKAVYANLCKGMGENFVPNGFITREDAALIIFRMTGDIKEVEKINFSDESDISSYAKDAVKVLSCAKVLNGMGDGTFKPKATLTRAQAAVMINAALEKIR